MIKSLKKIILSLLTAVLFSVVTGTAFSLFGNTIAAAEIKTGNVIDMTVKSFYDCQIYEGADFYDELGSSIMSNPTFKIRLVGGQTGNVENYIDYAVDIPKDTKHFYIDGVFSGDGVMFISTTDDFENYKVFDPMAGVKHIYTTIDVFAEEYLNGKPETDRLFFRMRSNPKIGGSLQVVDRLRFFHDGSVAESEFFPEVYTEKETGFAATVKDLKDDAYRIYGEKTTDTYKGVMYNTYISNGEVGNNLSHCSYALIDAPYGVYKFSVPEEDTDNYVFSNLLLKADVWGTFRLSVSTGNKITSEEPAAYTSLALWTDILCGSRSADKQIYTLDVTKFLDSSKVIYVRITDASDNDKADGGAYLSGLKVSSVYKYQGEPVVTVPDTLNSGVVGFPVDLSVVTAKSGAVGYGADLSYTVKKQDGSDVSLNESGISFTPDSTGTYNVTVTATDGNLNKKDVPVAITVREAAQVSKISVSDMPAAEKFLYNKKLDLSGGRLKVEFADNSLTYVSMSDCVTSLEKLSQIGKNTVELSFGANGNTYTCDVDLECSDYIRAIEVIETADKKYYTGYESLDLSGSKLKAWFEAGTAKGNSVDFVIVDLGDESVSYEGYYSTDAGEQTLKIKYEGCECDFTINVLQDVLLAIEIKDSPKTEYNVGEIIDLRDGSLKLTFQSGRIGEISLAHNDVYFSGFDNTASGTCTVKFEYGGFDCSVEMNIVGGGNSTGEDKPSESSSGCSGSIAIAQSFVCLVFLGFAVYGFKKSRKFK